MKKFVHLVKSNCRFCKRPFVASARITALTDSFVRKFSFGMPWVTMQVIHDMSFHLFVKHRETTGICFSHGVRLFELWSSSFCLCQSSVISASSLADVISSNCGSCC